MHLLLAAGFMLYFFPISSSSPQHVIATTVASLNVPPAVKEMSNNSSAGR